jgi:hypothetical protein
MYHALLYGVKEYITRQFHPKDTLHRRLVGAGSTAGMDAVEKKKYLANLTPFSRSWNLQPILAMSPAMTLGGFRNITQ